MNSEVPNNKKKRLSAFFVKLITPRYLIKFIKDNPVTLV